MESKKRHILVVEDEKSLADLIAFALGREGYDTDVAYDGEEGLNRIKSTKPDLVLLDLIMPKLDGRDLLKMMKKDESIKHIPVIVLSGRDEKWDRDIGLDLGAEEYIEKPLDMIKLMHQIRSVFRKMK